MCYEQAAGYYLSSPIFPILPYIPYYTLLPSLTRHLLSPLSCKAAQQLQQYKVQLDTCCQYQMVKFTLYKRD